MRAITSEFNLHASTRFLVRQQITGKLWFQNRYTRNRVSRYSSVFFINFIILFIITVVQLCSNITRIQTKIKRFSSFFSALIPIYISHIKSHIYNFVKFLFTSAIIPEKGSCFTRKVFKLREVQWEYGEEVRLYT